MIQQEEKKKPEEEPVKASGPVLRLVRWFDSRLGLSYPLLRPVPQYSINPFYWLGALTVVAFVIQGITGVIMMLYYVPSPTQAWSSTSYIFQNVSYGRFLETVHLYTAYAMIMLAFMHMMRGYFVSVHKKPREVMWIVGMIMGFVTLGFGFTGYLLPWTVVSKSATDVGVGMINALPAPLASLFTFLIVGGGGDAAEILRFYDLHVVVLPAVLLVLLAVKMYMLEAHGISEPVFGKQERPEQKKPNPIFPDVTLYLLELAAIFGAGMMLISALFPLTLPQEYSPIAAANTAAQPDWYFLWIYQILKISIFEQSGPLGAEALSIALTAISLIFVVLILLPFIDRTKSRKVAERPVFVTLGAIFVAELAILSYWGLVSPGQIIPLEQAVIILGGLALVICLVSLALFKLLTKTARGLPQKPASVSLRTAEIYNGLSFAGVVGLGALTMGTAIDAVTQIALSGFSMSLVAYLLASLGGLALSIVGTLYLIYRSDLKGGMIKRRIALLEYGWEGEGK